MEGFFVSDLLSGSKVNITIKMNETILMDLSVDFCDFGMHIWQNRTRVCPPRQGDVVFTRGDEREIIPYFVEKVRCFFLFCLKRGFET